MSFSTRPKEGIAATEAVLMVGDSLYDYEGARETKVEFLGVSYGFGFQGNEADIRFIGRFTELLSFVG